MRRPKWAKSALQQPELPARPISMRLQIAYVSARRERLKSGSAQELAEAYVARAARLSPTALRSFRSEEELLAAVARQPGRTRPFLIVLDSRGRSLSSHHFADFLRNLRDSGTQEAVLAIGPADGWSAETRAEAGLLLSFGPMTLPHELALVLLAEQTYRALTILAGHPYHGGHE